MNTVTQLHSTGDETKVDCRSEMYMTNYFVFIVIFDKIRSKQEVITSNEIEAVQWLFM